jgi:hypothetical protein
MGCGVMLLGFMVARLVLGILGIPEATFPPVESPMTLSISMSSPRARFPARRNQSTRFTVTILPIYQQCECTLCLKPERLIADLWECSRFFEGEGCSDSSMPSHGKFGKRCH